MFDYNIASPQEIADHFDEISRQRISQIVAKYDRLGNKKVLEKIVEAKKILKLTRLAAKKPFTIAECEKIDKLWHGVRCRVGKRVSYLDCTIEWPNKLQFGEWAIKQIGFGEPEWELDKDILTKGNRVYGPDTCVFVPLALNSLLSGCYKSKKRGAYPIGVSFNKGSKSYLAQASQGRADRRNYLGSFPTPEAAFACYKAFKEARIRAAAEKWKDRIDPRAYEALMARTVEWDD